MSEILNQYKDEMLEIAKCDKKTVFMYNAAQDKLQSTINSHDYLEKKILILFSYLIAISTFMISYLITHSGIYPYKYRILIALSACVFLLIILVYKCLRPSNFFMKGTEPSNIISNMELCKSNSNIMIVSETINYEERILINRQINQKNQKIFNFCLLVLLFVAILFLIPFNFICSLNW